MKKFLLPVLLLLLQWPLQSQAMPFVAHEEFAFYLDTRGDMEFVRGYWALQIPETGQTAFFIRNFNLKTNEETNYLAVFGLDENGKVFVEDIIGLEEDQPEILQAMVDIMNFYELYTLHQDEIGTDTIIDDPWENYTLLFHFNSYLPVFQFDSIRLQDSENPDYILLAGGRIMYEDQNDFFTFVPLADPPQRIQPECRLESRSLGPRDIDQYTVMLDDRWVDSQADSLKNGYWLQVNSQRDSQISVERIDWDVVESWGLKSLHEFVRLPLYQPNEYMLLDSLEIVETDEYIEVQYHSIYNKISNFAYRKIFKEGDDLVIINFSSFSRIYLDNSDYFDRIIRSIGP